MGTLAAQLTKIEADYAAEGQRKLLRKYRTTRGKAVDEESLARSSEDEAYDYDDLVN